jgi:hypothetical protein
VRSSKKQGTLQKTGEAMTQNKKSFDVIIKKYTPETRDLALGARDLIIEVMPRVVEIVWEEQGVVGYGTGPKKKSEHFCHIVIYPKYVNLGFNYGSELPDPDKLLEGTGKLFRHTKIKSKEDLKKPALRALIEQASKHRVPALPPES